MIEKYLEFCREVRQLRNSTIKEYRYLLQRMGKVIDWKNPGDQSDIERSILQAKEAGNWSVNYTAKVSSGILIPWFAWLSENNHLPYNPYIRSRFKKEKRKEPEFITQKEFDFILTNPMLNLQDHALLRLAWDTGARRCELLTLDHDDVDLKDNVIQIQNEKSKGGYGGRIVPFTKTTGDYLAKQIEWVKNNTRETAVFVDSFNCRYSVSSCDKRIRSISQYKTKDFGPVNFHLHTLRHSLGMRLLERGANESYVSKLLGHSSLDQTLLYIHYSKSRTKEVYEKLISC